MEFFFGSLLQILNRSWLSLLEISPYLAAGVVLGEILKLTSWTNLIRGWVSRTPVLSILAAAVLGAVSPLCTVGTVPVMLELLRSGVSIAPLVTFLTVSSMMNPQLFVITWGGLGAGMAFARLAAVLVYGLALGLIAHFVPRSWIVKKDIPDRPASSVKRKTGKKPDWSVFIRDVLSNLVYVGFYVVIGTLLGTALEVFLPRKWAGYLFQRNEWVSILFAAVMGVPFYTCGGGTIPLVQSFMREGMSKAAALAFLIVGPATRVAPLAALAGVVRIRFIVFYILSLAAFALAIGAVYR